MRVPHTKVTGEYLSAISKDYDPYMQVFPEKRGPNRVVPLSHISVIREEWVEALRWRPSDGQQKARYKSSTG